jgi:hypothetical protein
MSSSTACWRGDQLSLPESQLRSLDLVIVKVVFCAAAADAPFYRFALKIGRNTIDLEDGRATRNAEMNHVVCRSEHCTNPILRTSNRDTEILLIDDVELFRQLLANR